MSREIANLKALSIMQPWAHLIAHGLKPYENRTWNTKFRGDFLIHAGLKFDQQGYEWVRKTFPVIWMPEKQDFLRGGIVGRAHIYSVATAVSSEWFSGPFGFCIIKAKPVPFIPCKGMLGFFTPKFS